MNYQYIDPDKIAGILFDDPKYVADFCKAGITSLDEFIEGFRTHLMDRNMEDLRKAGHKIKPGAQMMGADEVIEEYEIAKDLLKNDADAEKLARLVDKMQEMCNKIRKELTTLAENQ